MKEQIEKLILDSQQQHAQAVEQIQKWVEMRLRAEGALIALRTLHERIAQGEKAQESETVGPLP